MGRIVLRTLGGLVGLALTTAGAPAARADWRDPVTISTQFSSQRPVAAMNAAGDIAVAWQRAIDRYNTALQLAVRPRGSTTFLPATDISAPDLDPAREGDQIGHNTEQAVAVGPDGSSLVLWRRGLRLLAMSIPPGAPAGPRAELALLPTTAAHPAVGIDHTGRATAAWREGDTLVVAVRPPGAEAFGPAQPIVELHPTFRYDAAFGTGGTAAIAWRDDDALRVLVRDGDGPWAAAAPITLSPQLTNFGEIDVSVGPRGDVVLAWAEQVEARGHIRAAVRRAAGPFGRDERLADVFFTGVYETNTAVDGAGNALVTWVGGSRNPDLVAGATARYRPSGGPWAPPEAVSSVVDANEPPAIAFDAAGNAYASWRYYEDNRQLLARAYASVRPAGATFGPVTSLVPADANVWRPEVAAGGDGQALIVYNRGTFPYEFHIEAVDHGGTPPTTTTPTDTPPANAHPQAAAATQTPARPAAPVRQRMRRFAAAANAGLRARRLRGGTLWTRIVAPGTARVTFTLEYRARRWRTAGSTTRRLTAGRPITLRFELSRSARHALSRKPAPRLRVRAGP